MATGPVTVTTAANFIPELWSNSTLDFRQAKLVCADRVDRSFESELKHGDTLHVPNISELSVRLKAANTAITYENFTESVTDIPIDNHTYVAIKIEDIVKVQSKYDLMAKYTGQFGYNLAKDLDTTVNSIFDGFSQSVGTLLVGLTEEEIRRAVQYLNDANAPSEDRSFFVSPAEMNNLMSIDRLINKDYNLATSGPGSIGAMFGIPVFETTNLEGSNGAGHDCALLQRSAIALAVQQMPTTVSEYSVDDLAWKTAAHQVYGKKEMRDSHGVLMLAK